MSSNKKKPNILRVAIIAAAVLLLVVSAIAVSSGYVMLDGEPVRRDITELDLSGQPLDDPSILDRFSELEYLDLRGTFISAEEYLEIQQKLPDCRIDWSVPVGNEYFDSSAEEIHLSSTVGVTGAQIEALRYMENLRLFDATAGAASDEAARALMALSAELTDRTFMWSIGLGDALYPHDTTEITITEAIPAADYGKLNLLADLTSVTVTGAADYRLLGDTLTPLYERGVTSSVSLAGSTVLSTEQEIDISGCTVDDLDGFLAALYCLPGLNKLDMCGCGLTNEQMEQLMQAHPDKKFVWTISFVRWTDVRTDITCFSSLNHSTQLYDETDLEPLFKYCTDLVALDLGHSSIVDISMISNLTKLQALILGDNNITDITPLGALKDLEYLELWKNDFTDISVLTTLPNLKDLNLSYCNDIEDFEPLFNLPCIEMIWLQHTGFPESLPERLEEAYPDCMLSFYGFQTSHGNGWCAQDRYLGIRKAFRNWQYVICYTSWDDVVYQEGVKLLPAIKKWD